MVRHNNMIPNGHFHKNWQRYVKVNFDQPMKKLKRQHLRKKKMVKLAPRPIDFLRPIVRCPSSRYNTKLRLGRGFSVQELKTAKINPRYARTIGIAVDKRRRNSKNVILNTTRLKEYMSRLVLLPKKKPRLEVTVRDINEYFDGAGYGRVVKLGSGSMNLEKAKKLAEMRPKRVKKLKKKVVEKPTNAI